MLEKNTTVNELKAQVQTDVSTFSLSSDIDWGEVGTVAFSAICKGAVGLIFKAFENGLSGGPDVGEALKKISEKLDVITKKLDTIIDLLKRLEVLIEKQPKIVLENEIIGQCLGIEISYSDWAKNLDENFSTAGIALTNLNGKILSSPRYGYCHVDTVGFAYVHSIAVAKLLGQNLAIQNLSDALKTYFTKAIDINENGSIAKVKPIVKKKLDEVDSVFTGGYIFSGWQKRKEEDGREVVRERYTLLEGSMEKGWINKGIFAGNIIDGESRPQPASDDFEHAPFLPTVLPATNDYRKNWSTELTIKLYEDKRKDYLTDYRDFRALDNSEKNCETYLSIINDVKRELGK